MIHFSGWRGGLVKSLPVREGIDPAALGVANEVRNKLAAAHQFHQQSIERSFVAFHPLAAFAERLADCFGPLATAGATALPAVDGRLRLAGGAVSSTAAADDVASAGLAVASAAAVVSVLASAGPAPASTGAAKASTAAGVAVASVVVVAPASCWLSSAVRGLNWLPATAASDAPAKKIVVKTSVVASRRFLDLGSPDAPSAGAA